MIEKDIENKKKELELIIKNIKFNKNILLFIDFVTLIGIIYGTIFNNETMIVTFITIYLIFEITNNMFKIEKDIKNKIKNINKEIENLK
ncbi:MAG TPA: hypothetical protein PK993_04000 [Clostridia bacterium]|nr:hypothetical protein [Clostridia bacterium]